MNWDELARGVATWLPAALGTAVLGGLIAFAVQRIGRHMDHRANDRAASGLDRRHQKQRAANLRRLRHRRVTAPGQWRVAYDYDLPGHVNLIFQGAKTAHRVRIDVLARGAGYSTKDTILISSVPANLDVTIPLGVPARARLSTIAIEWDDHRGLDHFDRIPLASYL